MKTSRTSFCKPLPLAALAFVASALVPSALVAPAHAQPDTGNAPKADNPANRVPRGAVRVPRPDRDMAPEDRLKWFVKRQFSGLGADDAAQETLAAFVQSETEARQQVAEKSQPLQTALRADALTDAQVAALLNAYQGALEDEKVRRAAAIAALDKAIDFKKSPKIEAALTIAGLIGDGPMTGMNGLMRGGFRRGMGERGNRGNQPNRAAPAAPEAAPPAQGV